MRIFIISLFILLTISPFSHLYSQYTAWENISNQIPGDSLNNLSDVSGLSRWAGFISSNAKPEIYRSVFSTVTWEVLQTPSPVTAFYMITYDHGFMCGVDSTVYQTNNACEDWIYLGSLGENINGIDFGYSINDEKGYVCGNNGVIGSIEDTGLTIIQSGLNTNFSNVSSPLKGWVWLLADSSIYFYDGSSFMKLFTSTVSLHSIHFTSEIHGWAVGDYGYIARTSDGGNTWIQKQNLDILKRNLNDISLRGRYGWVVGDDGLILRTNDSGEKWFIETDWLTSNKLLSVHFGGGGGEFGLALAVGENKTVLIWPVVVSVDDEPTFVDNFQLYQNYPNPFNPTTKIKYTIPTSPLNPSPYQGEGKRERLVTLKVYDVLGNEVATLVNEEKPAGNFQVEFNGTRLVSGIYFYQLRAGDYTDTRKMILLR